MYVYTYERGASVASRVLGSTPQGLADDDDADDDVMPLYARILCQPSVRLH